MTLPELFEDHLKLAVRVAAGKPLRAGQTDLPTAWLLTRELDALEARKDFQQERKRYGSEFEQAKYAVDALIDQIALGRFGADDGKTGGWIRRDPDPNVGHNFYDRVVTIADGDSINRRELLEVYLLCELLAFQGDERAKNNNKVRDAFNEVLTASAATNLPVSWRDDLKAPSYDSQVAKSHRILQKMVVAFAITYPVLIFAVAWLAWFGFDRR